MDVIFELLMLIDLFMNASLTTQILASIFLLLFYLVLRVDLPLYFQTPVIT